MKMSTSLVIGISTAFVIGFIICSLLAFGCSDFGAANFDGGEPTEEDGSQNEDGSQASETDSESDAGQDAGGDIEDGGVDDGMDGGGDEIPPDCPEFISALAECSYQFEEGPPEICPVIVCLDARCERDADCPQHAAMRNGEYCVTGNCVYCWQDSQCSNGFVCRGGRCTDLAANPCGNNPPCTDAGCNLVSISEQACPVCVCDSIFTRVCEDDMDCMIISSYPYRRCVYGRCTDCRHDEDCNHGRCLPPGKCYVMNPHPEVLYGVWLIGWGGGMDHFSHFRFEPDGTLRRGFYEPDLGWSDDIPPLPCYLDPMPEVLIGSWEPGVTASAVKLVIRMSLNVPCDNGTGWVAESYWVEVASDGMSAYFHDQSGNNMDYWAFKKSTDVCNDDFTSCQLPTYP